MRDTSSTTCRGTNDQWNDLGQLKFNGKNLSRKAHRWRTTSQNLFYAIAVVAGQEVLLGDFVLHRWSNLNVKRSKRRKPPVRQSKRMGSYVDNSFATTSYSLDEERSQMSRRSIGRELVSTRHSTRIETHNDPMVRVEKVLTVPIIQVSVSQSSEKTHPG